MIRSILDYFRRQRDYRRVYKELSKLTDRELKDIGLSRSMIARIALDYAYEIRN